LVRKSSLTAVILGLFAPPGSLIRRIILIAITNPHTRTTLINYRAYAHASNATLLAAKLAACADGLLDRDRQDKLLRAARRVDKLANAAMIAKLMQP
jgi:tellurite resistance protein